MSYILTLQMFLGLGYVGTNQVYVGDIHSVCIKGTHMLGVW